MYPLQKLPSPCIQHCERKWGSLGFPSLRAGKKCRNIQLWTLAFPRLGLKNSSNADSATRYEHLSWSPNTNIFLIVTSFELLLLNWSLDGLGRLAVRPDNHVQSPNWSEFFTQVRFARKKGTRITELNHKNNNSAHETSHTSNKYACQPQARGLFVARDALSCHKYLQEILTTSPLQNRCFFCLYSKKS